MIGTEVKFKATDCILVVARVSLLTAILHAVNVDSRIVTETDVIAFCGQIVDNLIDAPSVVLLCVEQGVVSDNEVCAVSLHKRVLYLVLFGQLFFRDHFVCLDESDTASVGHSDIDLPKSIFTGAAYTRLKVCHIDVYLMVDISLILTNLRW